MKEYFLSDIAEIRFGINARTQSHGGVACLQGKDFDEFGEIDHAGLLYVSEDQCKDTDFLKPGDVLFAAKGSRNYAIMWRGEIPRAVASSTFFVIRNLHSDVFPEYLAWYLISAQTQRYLERNVKNGTVKTVSKKALENIGVQLPGRKTQDNIIKIYQLYIYHLQLANKLAIKRKSQILNLLNEQRTKKSARSI